MNAPLKNYDKAQLQALDIAHHLPAQADWGHIKDIGGSRIVTHAEGCNFFDIDGNKYFDGMAGLWCVAVGYGRKELAEAAYNQMLEMPYYNTFFKTATVPAIELAAKIPDITGLSSGKLQHVFFNSSGSEAVDTMYRLVRRYWSVMGQPYRKIFISRQNGYHGSTVLGASLGGMSGMHAMDNTPVGNIERIMQPYKFGLGLPNETDEEFCNRAVKDLEDKILEVGAHNVAAFVGEPIQGAGGVIIPPEGYWPKIEAVCRKYGILLVCDEVICGYGRTGQWFGHQTYGVSPDIITTAKQLSSGYAPISATIVSSDIIDVMREGKDFAHGYTYSGHPMACAVASANLDIIANEGLVAKVREETGPYLAESLKRLDGHELVGEARSKGLMGAVEIVSEKGTTKRFGGKEGNAGPIVRDACIRNGLMVRGIRDSIVMCPPLIAEKSDIDFMVDAIEKSLNESQAELSKI